MRHTADQYTADRHNVVRIAEVVQRLRKGEATHLDLLNVALEVAASVPIRVCPACGLEFVQGDYRRQTWCSARCRYRIAQRVRRRRVKEATA